MSYSLRIESGDLIIGSNRALEVVTGKQKLFQDLKLWILERIGTDPATPLYGSVLDGGTINGQELASFIGQVVSQQNMNLIKAAVLDLLHQYQAQQLAKMKTELVEFDGRHTLSGDEILHSIDSVEVAQQETVIIVRVKCTTLNKTNFNLTIPLAV